MKTKMIDLEMVNCDFVYLESYRIVTKLNEINVLEKFKTQSLIINKEMQVVNLKNLGFSNTSSRDIKEDTGQ